MMIELTAYECEEVSGGIGILAACAIVGAIVVIGAAIGYAVNEYQENHCE